MALRLKRAWLTRTAVTAAVVALPLFGAGSAQAAIAGASPEKTTNRPDLISATILANYGSGGTVDFCFDKSIANPAGGGGSFTQADFVLGGYRAGNAFAADGGVLLEQNSSSNTPTFNCVRASYSSAAGDLNQYTVATVGNGSVLAQGGDLNNLEDSTALTGSTTHNGTTGLTAAPDLTGVLVDTTTNSITYVEDQNIGTATPNPNDFFFTDAGGNTCYATGGAAIVSGNTVTVNFAGPACFSAPGETVSNAVRAGQFPGAVTAQNDPNVSNTEDEVPVPNAPNGGRTAKPDLVSATLEPAGGAIDFTFDDNVTPVNASCFAAGLSTGDQVAGSTASVIAVSSTSTTVRVVFPNLAFYDEYVVKGAVIADPFGNGLGCAVQTSAGGKPALNTPGSAPAGDNAGAFARGFTTGADVFAAVLNKTTGVASISLDQRAFHTPNPGNIQLLDATGNVVASATAGDVTFPAQAAGPETITAQFTPGQVANAANLAVENSASPPTAAGAAFTTDIGSGAGAGVGGITPGCFSSSTGGAGCQDQPNVSQILSTTTTASLLKLGKAAQVASKHHAVNRKALARHQARLRAASKHRLAHLLAQAKKHHKHNR